MNIKPRAIVLIPGYMLDETLWCEFEKYLPPEIVIYHTPIAGGKTIRDITQHIIALLPEKFTVIGFSLGGYIARQLAADFPERIESLVLVASSLREDTQLQIQSKQNSVRSLTPTTFKGLSSTAIARSLHPGNADDLDMIVFIQRMGIRLGFDAFIMQSTLLRQDVPAASIRCPTLVIASSDDAIRTLGESEELAKAIPGARLETMNGCGHMLPLEQPKTLSTYITAWLATIN